MRKYREDVCGLRKSESIRYHYKEWNIQKLYFIGSNSGGKHPHGPVTIMDGLCYRGCGTVHLCGHLVSATKIFECQG